MLDSGTIFIASSILALAACSERGPAMSTLKNLAPEAERAALGGAEQHIFVVRHALKACNKFDCNLSGEGKAQTLRLAALLEDAGVSYAASSAARRTMETARAATGLEVDLYQTIDGLERAYEAPAPTRTRDDAIAALKTADAPKAALIADHSNFVCTWIAAFEADAALGHRCFDGALSESDYGDIFWLYKPDGGNAWRVVVLDNVFGDNLAEAEH